MQSSTQETPYYLSDPLSTNISQALSPITTNAIPSPRGSIAPQQIACLKNELNPENISSNELGTMRSRLEELSA